MRFVIFFLVVIIYTSDPLQSHVALFADTHMNVLA